MKRMILTAVMLAGISIAVSAQTGTGNSSRTTGAVSPTGKGTNKSRTAKSAKTGKGRSTATTKRKPGSPQLSEREIYQWINGQRATPTGTEATPSNGDGFASLKKDTTAVKKKGKQR